MSKGTARARAGSLSGGPVVVLACLLGCGLSPALRAQEMEHRHAARPAEGSRLGTVAFPNSGAPGAQAPFVRGIALLHSFEYDDAAAAFQQAERADPAFALPYWFEAFTHSHLLWGEDDSDSARAVLRRLAPTPEARLARAATARERSYGAAIEAFFADTTEAVRARAFADSMTALAGRDSSDLEASAFAALGSLLALSSGGYARDQRQAAEARAIDLASRVFRLEPQHPGAPHYLIHVTDLDPSFATRALPAARAYSRIAPESEHALHMPSHVFLPLGLWDDVASSNERAWAASRHYVAEHHLSGADLDFHSLWFLEYAYLQQGRWRAARALLDTTRAVLAGADLAGAEHVDAQYARAQLAALYAGETGRWSAAVAPPSTPATFANHREMFFALDAEQSRLVAAAGRGDTAALAAGAGALRAHADSMDMPPMKRWMNMNALKLEALVARGRGQNERAIELAREASEIEDLYPPVGPAALPVARELLGELLLAGGHAAEAAQQYELVLTHLPNRSAALLGLARARAATGDSSAATQAYRRLLASWHAADGDLPALPEVRRGARGAGMSVSTR